MLIKKKPFPGDDPSQKVNFTKKNDKKAIKVDAKSSSKPGLQGSTINPQTQRSGIQITVDPKDKSGIKNGKKSGFWAKKAAMSLAKKG